jgi:nucleotidyltransferase substrate binding protein (TIGR01987 family)
METTGFKINALKKALRTLEEAVRLPVDPIVRDATIQRFEYTFDILWKCLMAILRDTHGLACNSPKSCFRAAFSVGLCGEQETETLIAMTDDRNATAHTYSEDEAVRIQGRISDAYLPLMCKLADAMEGEAGSAGKLA